MSVNTPTRLIEVDERTAVALGASAAERGLSVPDLVAEMTMLATSPEALSTDEVAELDRRWAAIETGEPTISNDAVVRWLRTWESPTFKSWYDR